MHRSSKTFKIGVITVLGACLGAVPLGATQARAAALPPAFEIQTTFTVSGDLVVGNVVTLNLTLTNNGTEAYPYNAYAWLLLSPALKRTNTPVAWLCESYRGHQGGLTQAVYNDFCQTRPTGPIPAGGSLTLAFPVKLLTEGDWSTVAESATGQPDAQGYFPLITRVPQTIHVNPAPPKIGGGGGGTTGGLPDLQAAGAKVIGSSPAVGAAFQLFFPVKNAGKIEATDVTLTVVLPDALTFSWASTDGRPNPCTLTGRTLSCAFGTIPPGVAGFSADIVVYAPLTAGTFTTTGTWTDSNGDSNLANNAATVSVTVK